VLETRLVMDKTEEKREEEGGEEEKRDCQDNVRNVRTM
jgi:hypothetical protein